MRFLLTVLVIAIYALHQDWWLWRESRPLVFGILPPGLFYHACYTLVVTALMGVLVKLVWPAHLEQEDIEREDRAA